MEKEYSELAETEVNTETIANVKTESETTFDDLPRLEDLLKSEKEIKPSSKIEGVTEVARNSLLQDKPFEQKQDKKKFQVKKRVKIVAGVYASVVALLLAFVGINAVTLTMLNKEINTNTNTIQAQNEVVTYLENSTTIQDPSSIIEISLNEPRDYSDDKKELTFLDKLTILFRNIFA